METTGLAQEVRERLEALEDLREACGMNCERLPYEVREALHRVPEIDKQHGCSMNGDAPNKARA